MPEVVSKTSSTATYPLPDCSPVVGAGRNSTAQAQAPRSPKVPVFDEPAKNKIKIMAENDEGLQILQSKMIETLEQVQQKLKNPVEVSDDEAGVVSNEPAEASAGPSKVFKIGFKQYLSAAFSNVPNNWKFLIRR